MTETERALEKKGAEDQKTKIRSFVQTFEINKRLFKPEVLINIQYCDALFEAGVINRKEAERLKNGLLSILKRSEFDRDYFFNQTSKSVENFIEEKLVSLVGETGKKIKIGRSEADLMPTVLRFWLRDEINKISLEIRELQRCFLTLAEKYPESFFILTNNQDQKFPLLFAHWCLAFFEILSGDRERLDEVWRRTNIMPLGSGVGIGSSFELDREKLAKQLGFEGITTNSLAAVGDRGFVLDFVNTASLIMSHFQQLNSDLLFYSDNRIKLFLFQDSVIKKILPKIRCRLTEISGFQTNLNLNLKGLGLGYHSDYEDQNKFVFNSVDLLKEILRIFSFVLNNMSFNNQGAEKLMGEEKIFETEILDYFLQREMTYEQAETLTARVIKLIKEQKEGEEIPITELKKISPIIKEDVFLTFNLKEIVKQKDLVGGTSPVRVSEAINKAQKSLEFEG